MKSQRRLGTAALPHAPGRRGVDLRRSRSEDEAKFAPKIRQRVGRWPLSMPAAYWDATVGERPPGTAVRQMQGRRSDGLLH